MRSVPSWATVQFWFERPSQPQRFTSVPFFVLACGSLRHLPLPPTCLTGPATPPAAAATVQVNDADPVACSPSDALTVTLYVPGLDGQPVISPAALIDSPAGSPDAASDTGEPVSWSGHRDAQRHRRPGAGRAVARRVHR